MIGLIAALVLGAGAIQIITKYVLRIKEPTLAEVWPKLEEQEWFKEWMRDERIRYYIEESKVSGLLSDPYYLTKLIHHKETRDGFYDFIREQIK